MAIRCLGLGMGLGFNGLYQYIISLCVAVLFWFYGKASVDRTGSSRGQEIQTVTRRPLINMSVERKNITISGIASGMLKLAPSPLMCMCEKSKPHVHRFREARNRPWHCSGRTWNHQYLCSVNIIPCFSHNATSRYLVLANCELHPRLTEHGRYSEAAMLGRLYFYSIRLLLPLFWIGLREGQLMYHIYEVSKLPSFSCQGWSSCITSLHFWQSPLPTSGQHLFNILFTHLQYSVLLLRSWPPLTETRRILRNPTERYRLNSWFRRLFAYAL